MYHRIRFVFSLLLFCVCVSPTIALQKVAILPIINIDKDPNFAYLEATITDSLKDRLREKLAFDELAEKDWTLVAQENFILRDEFYTRSAAMNLGILANQDIVIGGGFKPINKTKGKTMIHATAFLLDAKRKKTISLLEFDLPADSELFTAVGQVAEKMEVEARKVIPSKEEAAHSGFKTPGKPFFSDWSLGVAVGGGLYVSGYAQYFAAQLPALSAQVHFSMPKLFQRMTGFLGFTYLNHKLKDGNDSALQSLGASATTTNYLFSAGLGYQFEISSKILLEPFVGGGYALQTTSVTGIGLQSNLTNSFPLARAGVVGYYRINALIDVSLSTETFTYIESGVLTFVPLLSAGVYYKF